MSVAAPASFNPEEADNLEDVRYHLSVMFDLSYVYLSITNSFADREAVRCQRLTQYQ
jgi:hypothetical protein